MWAKGVGGDGVRRSGLLFTYEKLDQRYFFVGDVDDVGVRSAQFSLEPGGSGSKCVEAFLR